MKKKLLKLFCILNISYLIVFWIKRSKSLNNFLLRYGWSDYSYDYFKKVYERFIQDLDANKIEIENKSILEIGSGNLPALGYFFLAYNKIKYYCASDPYRHENLSTTKNIKKQEVINYDFKKDNIDLIKYVNINDGHLVFNENYLLFEKYDITLDSVEVERKYDLILSNAVLEHIKKDKMDIAIKNMASLLNPEGYMIHEIDFRDHVCFDQPLKNLRFSEKRWNEISSNTIFYTNRLKLSQFINLFKQNNFEIIYINKKYGLSTTKKVKLHAELSELEQSDLILCAARILVKKIN